MKLNSSNVIFSEYPGWWYVDLMDNIPLGIFRTTLEGKILFCNKTFATLFGFESRKDLTHFRVLDLYRDKKDETDLVKSIMSRGYVEELPVPFKKRDGDLIWCAVTAEAIFNDDGMEVFLDGVMRDITEEMNQKSVTAELDEMANSVKDLIVILDLKGHLLDINQNGKDLLGLPKKKLLGKSLLELLVPRYRELFHLFIFDTIKTGREECLLTVMDQQKQEHHLEFHAFLIKKNGRPHHIKGMGRDVTDRIKRQREQLSKEKFRGVLEMAGGVAHSLNQPLTIVNNLLSEVLTEMGPRDENYNRIKKVYHQIKRLNDLSIKIKKIKKYEAVDYVGGVKIVDLDKAAKGHAKGAGE